MPFTFTGWLDNWIWLALFVFAYQHHIFINNKAPQHNFLSLHHTHKRPKTYTNAHFI